MPPEVAALGVASLQDKTLCARSPHPNVAVLCDNVMTDQKTLKRFDDAIALMKNYCAGTMPQDPFAAPAWLMAGAHAMILIALQNVYVVSSQLISIVLQHSGNYSRTNTSLLRKHRL